MNEMIIFSPFSFQSNIYDTKGVIDMYNKVAVIGGDRRSVELAKQFVKAGKFVKSYALGDPIEGVIEAATLEAAVEDVDIVVGGIPVSRDGVSLNCAYCDINITFSHLFGHMNENQSFIGGAIKDSIKEIADKHHIQVYDLLKREDMAILNAIPSAEGAIMVAMQNSEITLSESKVLILGYGRISKVLAKMIKGFESNIHIAARKDEDLAWIRTNGYKAIEFKRIEKYLNDFDFIFNTVPQTVLGYNELKEIRKSCVIVDLASPPGGIDFERAKELGLNIEWALSLPGKVAPITSASYIKDTIDKILNV